MQITVFGANGPTGRILTRQAVAEGHSVIAFTRRPEQFPSADGSGTLTVHGGDIADSDVVEAAVTGADAVISVLGVPFSKEPVSVYSTGVRNMLDAMGRTGVKRLLCVSSSTMSPSPQQEGGVVFRKVMQPYVVNKLGRTLYDDMRRMETMLAESDVDWTTVRPSGLFTHGEVTDYEVGEDHLPGRFTAREDLADCLLRQVAETAYVRTAMAVVTTSVKPSMVQLIWREGIRKKD